MGAAIFLILLNGVINVAFPIRLRGAFGGRLFGTETCVMEHQIALAQMPLMIGHIRHTQSL